jgi:hypothetical protein
MRPPILSSLGLSLVMLASGLAHAQGPQAYPVMAAPAPAPRFSLSLERVGGFALGTIDPDGPDEEVTVTTVVLGGPLASPLAAPRLAFDYYAAGGFSLGAAFSFFSATTEAGDSEQNISGFLLEPRVGFRFGASPKLDLIPRISVGFGSGSIEDKSSGGGMDESSGTITVLTGSFTAVYRLTGGFNLLTGLAYDAVVAASGEGGGDGSSDSFDGSVGSLNLWFGLGGYFE